MVVYQKLHPFATEGAGKSSRRHTERKHQLSVPAASLWFDSHFESANLEKAFSCSDHI